MARMETLLARKAAERERRRLEALRVMAESSSGMAPCAVAGLDIAILVGLERDGHCQRQRERDSLGDLRFDITDAGRRALATGATA